MINKIALSSAILALTISAAYAGPCNTADRDAGSGKVPGYTGQTTGSASQEHPPTASMNKATENTATSSQDTQRQMQGQPTQAQEAERGKTSGVGADKGC